MKFTPLTSHKKDDALQKKPNGESDLDIPPTVQSLEEIKKTTEERIYIIFDDSGSMDSLVHNKATSKFETCLDLAKDATVDYMKNCKPHVSAVEIAPLNQSLEIPLTKNLPLLSAKLKQIDTKGSTPLFQALGKLVDKQSTSNYTRALIFTDGEATDATYLSGVMDWDDYDDPNSTRRIGGRPNLMQEVADMKIPVDLILIGDMLESALSANSKKLKDMAEKSGGVFMICKDGVAFKKNMKYFAPTLRHMLPAIASANSRGER
jgi:hypothetical protein